MKKVNLSAVFEQNKRLIEGLRKFENVVGEIPWTDGLGFDSMELCAASMNLNALNSGFYKPPMVRIKGLSGFYMINEDGYLHCDQRVVKESERCYRIQNLTSTAFNRLEKFLGE